MYLKNLTIHGFKSFANRTLLDFPASLIGIVGPNGSGKSNICDSIRWVLGEQSSKALRGERMDDVIFGGTSSINPSQFAEVRLTFDNKTKFFKIEEGEFTMIRRINRNGDSDYIINGESCRLKDIKELIMDTGLGRDAYSIIGQGMVDNIISTKGNERRTIIEEAAGIVKYKAQKNETLKKIAESQGNVDRLTDLIVELDRQLSPLSMKAQIARRFLILDEQLKTGQKKKLVFEFDKLSRELSLSKATAEEYIKKHDEHQQKIIVFTADIELMDAKIVSLNDKMVQIKKDNLDVVTEHETLSGVEKNLLSKISQVNANRESYTRTIDEARQKVDELESQNEKSAGEITETEGFLETLKTEEARVGEDVLTLNVKLKSSETEVSDSHDSTIDVINQLAAAKTTLNKHESELKFAGEQIKRIKFDIVKLKEKKAGMEERFKKGSSNTGASKDKLNKLQARIKEISGKLNILYAEEKKLTGAIQTATAELLTAKAQQQANDQIEKNFNKFKYGVKYLMQAKQQNSSKFAGIHGVVSELVSVMPEYETALEVALGGQLQSIIVEHSRDTEQCIDLLKRNNAGRVTFLPLNTIRPQMPIAIPKGLKGFIGIASEIVKFDEKFRNVFEFLLGNVMIVDTLQHVNEFTASNRFSGRIVTLGGELVNSSGAITGGSMDKNTTGGFFANTDAAKMLKSRIVYLDDKIDQDNIKLDSVRTQIKNLKNEEEQSKIEDAKLRTSLENFADSYEDNESALKNSELEMKAMEEDLSRFEKQAIDAETLSREDSKIVAELEEKTRLHQENVKKTKSSVSEERKNFEEMKNKLTNLKVEIASTTEKLNNIRKGVVDNQNEILALQKRLKNDETELAKFNDIYREKSQELADITQKLDSIKARTGTIIEEEESIKKEVESLQSQKNIKNNLINSRNKQAGEALIKAHELEVQQAEMDVNLRNLRARLELEFKIRENEFAAYRVEGFNYDKMVEEIAETQRAIDMLGMIELSSIEDYETLATRLNTIKLQRDDVLAARDSLLKIVEKIDRECTKMFMDTFTQINSHIGEIFQILFEGGSARLVLEDETKPLESHIDIKAQPPGKKLQSITLMSGGEKSMTALSLLFSILKVKPSPFCILDEVEAALDEFNVIRFIKMLNQFREKTQFLIITHNKQTMQHLDLLYGVTMEEKGISKIISVKLEEAYNIVDMQSPKAPASVQSA